MEPFRFIREDERVADMQSRSDMAVYVLQFPGIPELSVMVVHNNSRGGFIDAFGDFVINAPLVDAANAQSPQIPEGMLVRCTPTQGDTCPICLEDAQMVDRIDVDEETISHIPHPSESDWVSLFHCKHRFHRHCMLNCKSVNCPMCRTSHAV